MNRKYDDLTLNPIPVISDFITYTYNFAQISNNIQKINEQDLTLSFAIRIVDGIHSNYVGAINRTFMYDQDTRARALEMVLDAASKYNDIQENLNR